MPNKGERVRKLYALSHGHGVKPPKKWFNMLQKSVSKQYPKYSSERKGQIIGGIWSRMSTTNKKKIVRKYQK